MKLFVPGEAYYLTLGSSAHVSCFSCFNHFVPEQQAARVICRSYVLKPGHRFPRALNNLSFVYSSSDC
jgi:hypothetical protein